MDAASPMLARLARTRRRLPQLVLSGTDAQGRYFTIKMKQVYVTSYQTGGSSGARVRTETATISFTGLE